MERRDDLKRVIAVGCLAVYFKVLCPSGVTIQPLLPREEMDFRLSFLHVIRIIVRRYRIFKNGNLVDPLDLFRYSIFGFGQGLVTYAVHAAARRDTAFHNNESHFTTSMTHLDPTHVKFTARKSLREFWRYGNFEEFKLPQTVKAGHKVRIVDIGNFAVRQANDGYEPDVQWAQFNIEAFNAFSN